MEVIYELNEKQIEDLHQLYQSKEWWTKGRSNKQTVPPLLTKLDDLYAAVRRAVINTLGQLGDKQAMEPFTLRSDRG